MQSVLFSIINDEKVEVDIFYKSLPIDTKKHSKSVAKMTELLLELVLEDQNYDCLEDVDLDNIYQAVLYHDIGISLIPQRLLEKKEELTGAEYKVIKQHSLYGANVLLNNCKFTSNKKELFQLAAEIAIGHHERWDGNGYPHGVIATAIPLVARAVSIIDAFDSIVRGSCHRMPLPKEYAIFEVLQHSGSQFDPNLVEVFRKNSMKFFSMGEDLTQ